MLQICTLRTRALTRRTGNRNGQQQWCREVEARIQNVTVNMQFYREKEALRNFGTCYLSPKPEGHTATSVAGHTVACCI